MSLITLKGVDYEDIANGVLQNGHNLRFRAHGRSMWPSIQDGDMVEIQPVGEKRIRKGDVVLFNPRTECDNLIVHRVTKIRTENDVTRYTTQGDALYYPDGQITRDKVLGRVVSIEREGRLRRQNTPLARMATSTWVIFLPAVRIIYSLYSKVYQKFFKHNRELTDT